MPRVNHVKSARKDNPVCKKGESYYWWKRKNCAKQFSLTYPKQSQLTGSAYYGALYDLQEQVEGASPENTDDFEALRDEIAAGVREQGEQCTESRDNMPESLQDAPTGELLQERADACESAADEIESMEAPDEWGDIAEQQIEYDTWQEAEPQLASFEDTTQHSAQEQYDEAHEDWEGDEPTVDEPEGADLSEMSDAISNCIV